jgi:hypothetical protein
VEERMKNLALKLGISTIAVLVIFLVALMIVPTAQSEVFLQTSVFSVSLTQAIVMSATSVFGIGVLTAMFIQERKRSVEPERVWP